METVQIVVSGQDLSRALSNVLLFSEKDKVVGDFVAFDMTQDKLIVAANDQFIGAMDSAPAVEFSEDVFRKTFGVTEEDARRILQSAKDVRSKPLSLTVFPESHTLFVDYKLVKRGQDDEEIQYVIPIHPDGSILIDHINRCIEVAEASVAENQMEWVTYAVRPERLAKFAHIKSDKAAPMDMVLRPTNITAKIGPTFRAVIACVDRKKAAQNPDLPEGSMW